MAEPPVEAPGLQRSIVSDEGSQTHGSIETNRDGDAEDMADEHEQQPQQQDDQEHENETTVMASSPQRPLSVNPQEPPAYHRQQQQQLPNMYPPSYPSHLPRQFAPPSHHQNHQEALAMAQYYESQMRDHAAAYASAAAGAAWAAAQIACSSTSVPLPSSLPLPSPLLYGQQFFPLPPQAPPQQQGEYYPAYPNYADHHHHQQQNNQLQQDQLSLNGQSQIGYVESGAMDDASNASSERHAFRPEKRHQTMQERQCGEDNYNVRGETERSVEGNGEVRDSKEKRDSFGGGNKRGRRRMRSDVSSSSGGGGGEAKSAVGRGKKSSVFGGGSNRGASDSSEGSRHFKKKHQRKSPRSSNALSLSNEVNNNNETYLSLFGKDGLCALHEYCSKKGLPNPKLIFVPCTAGDHNTNKRYEEFSVSVEINRREWARGRGSSKNSAKQDAARRALQALWPGVLFHAETGKIIEIPTAAPSGSKDAALSEAARQAATAATTSLEELTPTLASRLAIAGKDDEESTNEQSKYLISCLQQQTKRRFNLYPGTSTTSEDDDDNAYYASRGASVCSELLHAMWQIDERIPEPPSYSYEEIDQPQQKRKASSGSVPVSFAVHRASFSCTATLSLRKRKTGNEDFKSLLEEEKGVTDVTEAKNSKDLKQLGVSDKIDDENDQESSWRVDSLEGVGTGATKREARHVASAKLLSLLFPDCNTMLEVKAAAEEMREKFAANKEIERGSKSTSRKKQRRSRRRNNQRLEPKNFSLLFPLPPSTDPPLPPMILDQLRMAIEVENKQYYESIQHTSSPTSQSLDSSIASVAGLSLSERSEAKTSKADTSRNCLRSIRNSIMQESIARQLSRQQQLEDQVEKALQLQCEHDEGKKLSPDELSEDDVGRIVLRRASVEDIAWVTELLSAKDERWSCRKVSQNSKDFTVEISPVSLLESSPASVSQGASSIRPDAQSSLASLLWGSVSVILILSRAIDPDDVLGCAVTTLGFSMKTGPLLKISEIAHEKHLPVERFLECLETFAKYMNCTLERKSQHVKPLRQTIDMRSSSKEMRLGAKELKSMLDVYTNGTHKSTEDASSREVALEAVGSMEQLLQKANSITQLSSVKEEECEGDEEKETVKADRRGQGKKPFKRSRVK